MKKGKRIFWIVAVVTVVLAIVQLYLSAAHDIGSPLVSLLLVSIPLALLRLRTYKQIVDSGEQGSKTFAKSVKFGLLCGLLALVALIIFFIVTFLLHAEPVHHP